MHSLGNLLVARPFVGSRTSAEHILFVFVGSVKTCTIIDTLLFPWAHPSMNYFTDV